MRVSPLEGHRVWAPSYGESKNPVLALERRTMARFLGSTTPVKVADVACGDGYWLRYFQSASCAVVGIDFCPEMLSEARRVPVSLGRVVLGDATLLPIRSEAVDLVLCSMALGYFPDLLGTFGEFARIAAPGARIAVSDLHPAAISAGWTRSFTAGDVHYEIDHHCRSLIEIDAAARSAGLAAKCEDTAYFGDPEYPIFQESGKSDLFAEVRKTPAVFLRMWEKPC